MLQNRAVRLIALSSFHSSSRPLYKELHLSQFKDIYKIQKLVIMYKCKNTFLPYACMHYCLQSVNNCYNMSNCYDFALMSHRTNIREQCIRVVGHRL